MVTVDRHHAVLVAVPRDDRDRARLDYEEVIVRVSFTKEHLPGRDRTHCPGRTQLLAVLVAEPREGAVLVGPLFDADAKD
jgi:hypothetical protein